MKTRFDYLGLSTDDKPTNEAVNGSTFKEVDTSKLYIFYEGEWYEKASSGGIDLSQYFGDTIEGGSSSPTGLAKLIKNVPDTLTVDSINLSYAFYNSPSLEALPFMDTSDVINMNYMCRYCNKLVKVPLLDTIKVNDMKYTFSNCPLLSDESLNNILKMCINTSTYYGTKTLAYVGLSSEQATTCEGLSNYADFLEAGWTTGY